MLDVSHNPMLVMASLAVSLMAGFTGLSLLHGASDMSLERRKLVVSLSAIVLGGGIWSMHFIAMLGMELPIDFYYDPLTTLISALVAILVVGLALLVLHFRERTWLSKAIAGALIGLGILAMHYLGMSGIRRCLPLYTVGGVTVAVLGSVALSIGAVWIAYGQRTKRNILLGTACFGLAVFAVHFVAMAGTSFVAVEGAEDLFPLIDNNLLAFIVTLGSFLICGGFLLNTATFAIAESNARQASLAPDVPVETEASVVQDENGRSGTQKA
ncbi:MAG: MHYT domain-containing protein, partial [Pseudomonadota bacterium]